MRGFEFEKRLKMVIKLWKEQKQVVIQHKLKIYKRILFCLEKWPWIVLIKKAS